MKKFKIALLTFAVTVLGLGFIAPAAPTYALDPLEQACTGTTDSEVCDSQTDSASDLITTIINTLLFIIGALSVIMIIWGGIRYTTSAGNANSITAAKNTIMYAVVGLIVALLAYAIVNWVVDLF